MRLGFYGQYLVLTGIGVNVLVLSEHSKEFSTGIFNGENPTISTPTLYNSVR